MNTLSERLAELSGKATKGPWEVDTEDNGDSGSERFNSYTIGAGPERWQTILSTRDSDVALIEEEWDGDENGPWCHRWDAQGAADCALIVELVNALRADRLIVKD